MWSHLPVVHPIIPPPPPYNCGQNKKQKLMHNVKEIFESDNFAWDKTNKVMELQEIAFNEYENEIYMLKNRVSSNDGIIRNLNGQVSKLYHQLNNKSMIISRKNNELHSLQQQIEPLRRELDSMSIRVVEAESKNEETTAHYKQLIKGLERTAANAEDG